MSRDAARALSGSGRTSLYDEITTKIIAELKAGRVPWVQPWGTAAAKAPLAMPKNASTGRFGVPNWNRLRPAMVVTAQISSGLVSDRDTGDRRAHENPNRRSLAQGDREEADRMDRRKLR